MRESKCLEDGNHAKLGHSLGSGRKLSVMGDMNLGSAFLDDAGSFLLLISGCDSLVFMGLACFSVMLVSLLTE